MKRSLLALITPLALLGQAHGQGPNDYNEGSTLIHNSTANTFTFSWWGRAGKSYFIQQTDDLLTSWHYFPEVRTGADAVISLSFNAPASDKLFLKLEIMDYNPSLNDRDGDGIPDANEVLNGLSPNNPNDALEDKDGDGAPNIYEIAKGKNVSSASDRPDADFIVNPEAGDNSSEDNIYTTISSAVSAASSEFFGSYAIIEVTPGVYQESVELTSNVHILLRAQPSENRTILLSPSNELETVFIGTSRTVLSGFVISRGDLAGNSRGVYVDLSSASGRVSLVNCIIRDCRDSFNGGAMYVDDGIVSLVHCALFDNEAGYQGRAVWLADDAQLIVRNTIVWNSRGLPAGQIHQSTPGTATAFGSLILGGELGAAASDPRLDRYGGLYSDSPALNTAPSYPAVSVDLQGDSRVPSADIGADERVDSDSDGLPDWWEIVYFGNLGASASQHSDVDGLTNFYEYVFGTNPTVDDSDGNGLNDLLQNALNYSDPWYPFEWAGDPDGDGLVTGRELLFNTDPFDNDSNNDGLLDGPSVAAGISPTSLDLDGDTLTVAQEQALGTSPFLADTDRDGANDAADAFPLDPNRWAAPTGSPSDLTAPQISLTEPGNATPI